MDCYKVVLAVTGFQQQLSFLVSASSQGYSSGGYRTVLGVEAFVRPAVYVDIHAREIFFPVSGG